MNLVIDTNRIIAALVRDSTSRRIILDAQFQFFAPDKAHEEIAKHRNELETKARVTPELFDTILTLLFEHISIVPKAQYELFLTQAKESISDKDDAPFIALALAIRPHAIWTDDKAFREQTRVRVLSTAELVTTYRL